MNVSVGEQAQKETPYLRIVGLNKQFGSFKALNDISLDINESEFICFLGPSGCGKTTLLRAIAGLDIQTSGQVFQTGLDISALPPSERDFGIVFQSYALFPNLNVRRNVSYGLQNRKNSRKEIAARVAELLQLVGLPDQGNKYPNQLSGGQQQRIALVRALATSPGLLLLDEPLSALDAKVRAYLRQEIKDLQRRIGVTTIMVTHDQEEALTMADRIVVMNQGVIEQVGTPGEIYQDPATEFVADFIGNMNFLEGQVTGGIVKIGDWQFSSSKPKLVDDSTITIAIRPEDVIIEKGTNDRTNRIDAQIQSTEFLGSFVRLVLTSVQLDGQSFRADLPMTQMRDLALQSGDHIAASIQEQHVQIYLRPSKSKD